MAARIVVPFDFSPAADRALDTALALAPRLEAEVDLVHVCTAARDRYHLDWTPAGFEAEQRACAAAAEAHLAAVVERSRHRVPVRARVVGPMEPAVGVLKAAAGADLVVLASQRRDRLGPVAGAVARSAGAPVLFVGSEGRPLPSGLRVLVPVDLSAASAVALRRARDLAARLGGAVDVLHAVPLAATAWGGEPVEADDEWPLAHQVRRLERFVEAAGGARVPLRLQIVEGRPVEAAARAARDGHPDLVVAGRPAARPASPDALLAAVSAAAHCPSLRVPEA